MKEYYINEFKEKRLISPEYSGEISNSEWDMNFLECKPKCKIVLYTIFVE